MKFTKKPKPAQEPPEGGSKKRPDSGEQELSLQQLRLRYINDLMAKGLGDDMDPALLDRIERLLGFQEDLTTPEGEENP